ncbi:DUF1295 domain-containing protein [Kaistia dalseonensis]|uniref:Steroid 5-alpha reductase family enzyme n=1 Tax=Kaistia dalseonensis TaxID=410840 RepID=A0ABU0H7N2_9HYPH|nr:DUF1295 domain-containing protein [Kaistia dalseonensis]MCX5495689.1 DUF1295 domain-containing protein [Kaistia dalseonensis]MDQ0438285.1 steroid 5-alpha reductase family enzyme [Kaistia dalseonensis]
MTVPVIGFVLAAIFLTLVMTGAWVAQRFTGNAGWSDAFWSFGVGAAGVALALLPIADAAEPTTRQLVVAALIGLWAIRLGVHIAARVADGPEDARYARFRQDWGADYERRLFLFLMIQAAAGTFLVLSVLLAAQNPVPAFRLQDWLAAIVLAISVIGEGVADRQLQAFKRDPANHGRVCDVGLWGWSRHPNYFFEWLGWCAYPLFTIDLTGGHGFGLLSLSGPLFMYWLLVHVSGIPPLEAHMLRSRPQAFRAYQARVSAFFPRPSRERGQR